MIKSNYILGVLFLIHLMQQQIAITRKPIRNSKVKVYRFDLRCIEICFYFAFV